MIQITHPQEDEVFIAKTLMGMEDVLRDELLKIGARDIHVMRRAVQFKGDLGFLYKANLCLGSALRILWSIAHLSAENGDELRDKVREIPWENYFDVDKTIAVYAVGSHPGINHTGMAALLVKDGIADRFRDVMDKRPNVDRENPDVRIELFLNRRQCIVSLDASGESLHRRGYRQDMGPAPMSEVLANGLVRLTGYRGDYTFMDGMTGSGTLAIEAAIIADQLPPGIYRKRFAFTQWSCYDKELHAAIEASSLKRISERSLKIVACDLGDLSAAKTNATAALVDERIEWQSMDFFDTKPPTERGILVLNPPYGHKMEVDVDDMYASIGAHLKKAYKGWTAWVVIPSETADRAIGMRASLRYQFMNGDIDCDWAQYEIFEGS